MAAPRPVVTRLAEVRLEHLVLLHGWMNSDEASGDFDQPSRPTFDKVQARFRDDAYSQTFIIEQDGEPIGFCNYLLHPWEQWLGVIGIVVAVPRARGRGSGTEAQRAIAELVFARHPQVNKVAAYTDVDNLAEQRALVKAGFRREIRLSPQGRGDVFEYVKDRS